PAERSRPREHRGGFTVRMGALRRPGRRDHRRQPFWRVGSGTHCHARVRLHARAHRRDGESSTATIRLLVKVPMPNAFKRGDLVEWNSEAGRVRGVIVKKLVSNIRVKGYLHHASKAQQKCVIKSVKTDHVAIHKGSALRHVRAKKR